MTTTQRNDVDIIKYVVVFNSPDAPDVEARADCEEWFESRSRAEKFRERMLDSGFAVDSVRVMRRVSGGWERL